MSGGALGGVRVLDATRALAGPFATMLLGDIGADVIKVELPEVGDETRYWGPPFVEDAGPTFIGFNRNKRSIALDLHAKEGQATFAALAETCDVVVENFRPGTVRRFAIDYDTLRARRPDIIYCSISGYGQQGPMSLRPAMDLLVQASSGMMSLTGEPDGRPVKGAAPMADMMAGFSAAFAILSALHERGSTGQGRFIDISMLDAMVSLLGQSVTAFSMSGNVPRRLGNGHALMAPYQSFRASDRELVIAVTNQKSWDAFCRIADFAPLHGRPEYGKQGDRNNNRVQLIDEVQRIFATRTAAEWMTLLDREGVPAEIVSTLPEVLANPQVAQRGTLMEVEYPPGSGRRVAIPGMPWRDAVAPEQEQRGPPKLGQHTDEILRELAQRRAAE